MALTNASILIQAAQYDPSLHLLFKQAKLFEWLF